MKQQSENWRKYANGMFTKREETGAQERANGIAYKKNFNGPISNVKRRNGSA